MKSFWVVFFVTIILIDNLAAGVHWSSKPDTANRIKAIKQKLDSFEQFAMLARKSLYTRINNRDKTKLWKELSKNIEETYYSEGSAYSFMIVFVGIIFITLVFYFHIKYSEWYLREYCILRDTITVPQYSEL